MCSVDSEEVELMKPKEKLHLIGATCRKCIETKASVLVQSKFPYCDHCFLSYFTHKFNACLGKSKLMKHGDKTLLAISGSSSSSCLMHLVKSGMDESRKKKITTTTVVCFIDDSSIFDLSDNRRHEIFAQIKEITQLFGFDSFWTPLDSFLKNDADIFDFNQPYKPEKSQCLSLFEGSLTSKTDLLLKMRNNVLVKAARKLKCNKIFLAETTDHLAINIISNVSLGRGNQLASDVGFCDQRYNDVLILRPLMECSKKEVIFYNTINKLPCFSLADFGTKQDKFSSIQKLTEDFITELQCSFPSTILTIVSTGNKLATKEMKEACLLCYGDIDNGSSELSAQQAIKISSLVSKYGPKNMDYSFQETSCGSCNCQRSYDKLCYSCHLILKDSSGLQAWLDTDLRAANEEKQLEAMRNEISDFLL